MYIQDRDAHSFTGTNRVVSTFGEQEFKVKNILGYTRTKF